MDKHKEKSPARIEWERIKKEAELQTRIRMARFYTRSGLCTRQADYVLRPWRHETGQI